jgi:hypothetical protein
VAVGNEVLQVEAGLSGDYTSLNIVNKFILFELIIGLSAVGTRYQREPLVVLPSSSNTFSER